MCLPQALHAFELALSLEKLNLQKLWRLDDVANNADDYEMTNFVEDMMHKQVIIHTISDSGVVSQPSTTLCGFCLPLLPAASACLLHQRGGMTSSNLAID